MLLFPCTHLLVRLLPIIFLCSLCDRRCPRLLFHLQAQVIRSLNREK
jgi:hypothetical protein